MELYGLVGEKLSHSLSPEIHKEIFKKLKIKGDYCLFEVPKERIKSLENSIKTLSIKGVNVTIPYKEEVIKSLDKISDEAKKIGAVNTIVNKKDILIGYNTDYYGFKYMLEWKNITLKDKNVVVLGTGGASKAVVTYAIDQNAKNIYLVSRKNKEYSILNDKIEIIDYNKLKDIKGDVIINTTPVGMHPNTEASPVSKEVIKNYEALVDLIYNPTETLFLKYGKELNKVTVHGLMMLVGQAVKAEEIWQGKKIDEEVILDIYKNLEKRFS
ncbi:shikimate dehydrogenase [Clostridium sp. LY3-2]|uniref:shikimate dehydrogenase n=1 Tax=Clostridium sp. LY3-2 TaxID=2942482 RepID=UPI0021539DC6|nr:shikimate dehydrogenase [Clostridium sp. LY3-2]MCR6516415.1 shikimate dehydrogenase [Clostridium sp. LY3-2]